MEAKKYKAMLDGIRKQVIVDMFFLMKESGATVIQLISGPCVAEDTCISEVDIKKKLIVTVNDSGNTSLACFADLSTNQLVQILAMVENKEYEIIKELSEE